jgi:hypothetical protein
MGAAAHYRHCEGTDAQVLKEIHRVSVWFGFNDRAAFNPILIKNIIAIIFLIKK